MKILVAGIGNIFLGDDAFGVEVVQRLSAMPLPPEVTVADFGIRSYDLAYAMMDGYDVTILLDATPQGQPPGTVSLIEPDAVGLGASKGETIDAHSMNPVHVLRMVSSLGGHPGRLYLIGCEPGILEADAGRLGLSAPVEAAVPHAIEMLRTLLHELLNDNQTADHALVEGG
jgi:hydrogenase maturation protease